MQLIPARGRLLPHFMLKTGNVDAAYPREGTVTQKNAALNKKNKTMQLSPARGRLHFVAGKEFFTVMMQLSPARGRLPERTFYKGL